MTSTVNLSSPDTKVLEEEVEFQHTSLLEKLQNWEKNDRPRFESYFEIDMIISKLSGSKYQNVGLQFPDEFLTFSVPISQRITQACPNVPLHILGDTTYSPCCIDEIAAQHSSCDLVIHFGRSCMSLTQRIDTLLCFGRLSFNCEDLVEKISHQWKETKEINSQNPVIVFYNPSYHHSVCENEPQLKQALAKIFSSEKQIVFAKCTTETFAQKIQIQSSSDPTIFGRDLGDHDLPEDWKGFTLLYIGSNTDKTLISLSISQPELNTYVYNPEKGSLEKDSVETNSLLMSRYFMMEKAKDAKVIGIVVQTLSVSNYLTLMSNLKEVINKSGRKAYTFVIGKINPPKMANFEVIDLFVLISCHENALFSSREYLKPMISPYELKLALTFSEWQGRVETQFSKVLSMKLISKRNESDDEDDPEEILHFSFSKGSYTIEKKFDSGQVSNNNNQLANRNNAGGLISWSPAASLLATREYKGLDPQLGQTPVAKIEKGLSGIPQSYKSETNPEAKDQ